MSIGKSRVAFTAMALLSIAAQVPAHTDLLQSTPADKSKVAAVEKIELKFKFSQNHPAANVQAAAAGLRGTGDPQASAVADIMLERLSRRAPT